MNQRWSLSVVMLIMLGCCVIPASALGEPAGWGSDATSQGGQTRLAQRESELGVEFHVAPAANGGAVVRLTAGRLSVVKSIRIDGSTTRVIAVGQDKVEIANDAAGVAVERGGRRAVWAASAPSEAAVEAVRALLAGSEAVRALRRLGSMVESRPDDSAFVLSTLMDHAFVSLLDGDEAAVRRLGVKIAERAKTRRNVGEGVVPVGWSRPARTRAVTFRDCVGEFYDYVGRSWGQYEQCEEWARADPWYQRGLHLMWCQREFEVRLASGFLQFLDCSGFPG